MRLFHAIANLAFSVSAILNAGNARAQSAPPPGASGSTLVKVSAAASVDTIHPGDQFLLAFRFEIAPHWHIYWKNPGDTGMPTAIDVAAPQGFEIGDILWQRPRLIPGLFTTYGYEEEAVLFVPVTAPDTLEPGEVTFTASIDWLVCQETCLSGDATVELSIETSATPRADAGEATSAEKGALAGFRVENEDVRESAERLPQPLDGVEDSTIERVENRITLHGPAHGATSLALFPSPSPGVSVSIVKQAIEDDRFEVVLEFSVNSTSTLGKPPVATGVIALGSDDADPSYAFEIALEK